jgi:hypothetical protein
MRAIEALEAKRLGRRFEERSTISQHVGSEEKKSP